MPDYRFRRGDICWYHDSVQPDGTYVLHNCRPAIIVSADSLNYSSETVIIVPLTTNTEKTMHPGQFDVMIGRKKSRVRVDQIRVADKRELQDPHCRLDEASMRKLDDTLKLMIGIDNPQFGAGFTSSC